MHRHGYKGRKFGRETDQRQALMRGLMIALIDQHEIESTEAKVKELRRVMEKIITKAKKGDLASRRLVISRVGNINSANKLIDEIAPKITRDSGYLRIERTRLRVGDGAQMAAISFVDDLTAKSAAREDEAKTGADLAVEKEKK